MQILPGVLVALALLAGAAIVLSLAIMAASTGTRPGQAPPGGIRRDPAPRPQPGTGDAGPLARPEPPYPRPDTDGDRELAWLEQLYRQPDADEARQLVPR